MKKSVKKHLGIALSNAQRVRQEALAKGQMIATEVRKKTSYADAAECGIKMRDDIIVDLDGALGELILQVNNILAEN